MIIKIDSLDTLFFRDGKPFTMGEDSWGNCIFPPNPSTLYGSLRSTYFSEHPEDLEKANEKEDPTKNLGIKGLYLLNDGNVYLPIPRELMKKRDKEKTQSILLSKEYLGDVKSSCLSSNVLKSDKEVENFRNGWIKIGSLLDFLEGDFDSLEPDSISRLDDFILSESKLGIGIDHSKGKSEEGKIYQIEMKRLENKDFKKTSILVEFENLDLPSKGMIKLGGEGKASTYEKYEESIQLGDRELDGNQFKLYLSTPGIFKKGWIPEWIENDTLSGEYKGIEIELVTATIGKPFRIGGFDMKKKKPKPMRKAVPAGSVYYFKVKGSTASQVFKTFNGAGISDYNSKEGYGIAYVGGAHKNG